MAKRKRRIVVDVLIRDEGSVVLLNPITDRAKDWFAENLPADAQWYDGGLVVEHRYADAIIDGMQGDGLVVSSG